MATGATTSSAYTLSDDVKKMDAAETLETTDGKYTYQITDVNEDKKTAVGSITKAFEGTFKMTGNYSYDLDVAADGAKIDGTEMNAPQTFRVNGDGVSILGSEKYGDNFKINGNGATLNGGGYDDVYEFGNSISAVVGDPITVAAGNTGFTLTEVTPGQWSATAGAATIDMANNQNDTITVAANVDINVTTDGADGLTVQQGGSALASVESGELTVNTLSQTNKVYQDGIVIDVQADGSILTNTARAIAQYQNQIANLTATEASGYTVANSQSYYVDGTNVDYTINVANGASPTIIAVDHTGNNTYTTQAQSSGVVIQSGVGDDTFSIASNRSTIVAGDGDNVLSLETSAIDSKVWTGDEADLITSHAARVTIESAEGNDTITTTGDGAVVRAGNGKNQVTSSGDNDNIVTGDGNDVIVSSGDFVTIDAGIGDDSISIGGKSALITGGNGSDTFDFVAGFANATIAAFDAGVDQLSLAGYATGVGGTDNTATITAADGGSVVLNNLQFTGNESIIDVNIGGEVSQMKIAKANADRTVGSEISVTDGVGYYVGTTGTDTLTVGANLATTENVWLDGSQGITYTSIENANASAYEGNLQLVGTSRSNVLIGGAGNSSLWGGDDSLNDTLIGGTGKNEFFYVVGEGDDVVQNYKAGEVVHLFGVSSENFGEVVDVMSEAGMGFKDGSSITLQGDTSVVTYQAGFDGETWTYQGGNWTKISD